MLYSDLQLLPRPKGRMLAVLTIPAFVLLFICLHLIQIQAVETATPAGSATATQNPGQSLSPISIDYPGDGSIFPPGITPPTVLWRDAAGTSWSIDISFAERAPAIHVLSKGERMHIGAIDRECIEDPEDLPKLSAQQAATWTWTPDAATWAAIQSHSTGHPATITISGYRGDTAAVSRSQIAITTSPDPVVAPIFYRDVPLMPTRGVDGVVQPLAPSTIHLIHWRLRDIRKSESHTVLRDMPTCANCQI